MVVFAVRHGAILSLPMFCNAMDRRLILTRYVVAVRASCQSKYVVDLQGVLPFFILFVCLILKTFSSAVFTKSTSSLMLNKCTYFSTQSYDKFHNFSKEKKGDYFPKDH